MYLGKYGISLGTCSTYVVLQVVLGPSEVPKTIVGTIAMKFEFDAELWLHITDRKAPSLPFPSLLFR